MKGFRDFLLRGNLVELAVGVVIALAFKSVIDALVKDLINPLIGAIGGRPSFDTTFTINGGTFLLGAFITDVISFVITAAVVYYFVVRPFARMMAMVSKPAITLDSTRPCPECVSDIPRTARRCAFCTAAVAAEAAPRPELRPA